MMPGPSSRRIVHITVQEPISNPNQILRPVSVAEPKKHASNPVKWLQENSNNKFSEIAGSRYWNAVSGLGHTSGKPKAALISLVRNSELPGIVQSMRQLEYQWNRKYNYPWIFFNDEDFSDEFKVSEASNSR